MAATAFDPRAICNLLLDEAGLRPITNLALQKLLYFAHGVHLIETKQPLVAGYFEAWEFGPVNPVAYHAFKVAGGKAITFRATRQDPMTGAETPLEAVENADVHERIRRIVVSYGRMTAGRLVEVAHAPGAPWDFVVKSAEQSMALGMRISDSLIVERFKYHKVSVSSSPRSGEPHEDTPFAGYRSR